MIRNSGLVLNEGLNRIPDEAELMHVQMRAHRKRKETAKTQQKSNKLKSEENN